MLGVLNAKRVDTVLRGYRAELIAGGRSRGTVAVRVSHARRCLIEIGKPPARITREDVVMWLAGHEWSPASRASARASIRSLWRYLAETGEVAEDITARIGPVIQPRPVPRPATDDIVRQAIARAPADIATAIELMSACGLRRGEVAGVHASHVHRAGAGYVLRVTGKGGHVRSVPLPPHLARRITAGGSWLIPGGDQGHISPGWLGKRISRYLPAGVTPHKLRHRFATAAYRASHDLRAVQTLLGHASVATTQVYVAVDNDAVRAAATATWTLAS